MVTATEADLLTRIVEQQEKIRRLRDEHREIVRVENRRLAELVAATRDDPDPDVNPTAAARAMGLNKNRAFQMIAKLEAGEL